MNASTILADLGIAHAAQAGDIAVHSPISGELIGRVASNTPADVDAALAQAKQAFNAWRNVPAPRRGELVRLLGQPSARNRSRGALGSIITLETGKILQEGLGEVQEMIDICDFAVGLSRQLYGLTIACERPRPPDGRTRIPWA